MSSQTGDHTEPLVKALLDAANDKCDDVRRAVCLSLHSLGKKKADIVLSCCSSYLQTHSKLSIAHRILVLKTIQKVCQDVLDEVPQDLACSIIKQAAEEMTMSKDFVPEWQNAASGILVAIGAKYCHEVMETLLSYFQPGEMPHFFIIQTLANLASANVYGIVPFLKAVLGTLLPMLGLMRHDNMKWVSSFALAKFCEAITEYVANIDKAPDPTVKIVVFATEISMAYNILFSWLQTKEPKLRTVIIEAFGHMAYLIPSDMLQEQLPRLIPGILTLYKRHADPYILTQSLCMILDVSIKNKNSALDIQLDYIIQTLFPQVCTLPDYVKPSSVKNHNEVLRCFSLISQAYPDVIIQMLSTNLENSTEKVRIGSLTILRHVINTTELEPIGKMTVVLNGLKNILQENNNKVKKVLAHLIVALAHHGYLEMEIGQPLVEFLIRQCALKDAENQNIQDENSNASLKAACENVLHSLTTTVPKIEKILWPHLLTFLIPEKYMIAVPSVSKNTAWIANKLKEENSPEYSIDFNYHRDIPNPHHLLARLTVLLRIPSKNCIQNINLLHLLKAISLIINKNIVALWDIKIPQLLILLKDKDYFPSQENVWDKCVLDLLTETLDEIDQEEWTQQLCSYFLKQMQDYSSPEVKSFTMKCLGVVLKKISDDEFVIHHLDEIFASVQHSVEIEREGCAVAYGIAAITHLDKILSKLDGLTKLGSTRRSSGIFRIFMDSKIDIDHELSKSTLILCYGYLSRYLPPSLLLPRVEVPILKHIIPYFQHAKEMEIKISLLQATNELSQALIPHCLKKSVHFVSRIEVLQKVQLLLAEESLLVPTEVRILAIDCIANLIKLDPPLIGPDREDYIKCCLDSVYPLPDTSEDREQKKLMELTKNSLNSLLEAMLFCDISPDNLFLIISNLEGWLQSSVSYERLRSIESIQQLLNAYLNNLSLGIGKPFIFGPLGSIIAHLIPRCTDEVLIVRQIAVENIVTTFQISAVYDGNPPNHINSNLQSLLDIREKIITEDPETLFLLTKEIGQIVAQKLPVPQVAPFLHVTLEGLLDNMPSSSCGACVVFNAVIKERGGELHQQVEVLMKLILHKMGLITCIGTKKALMQIIRTLANHHLMAVTSYLLSLPLPQESAVNDCWRALAQEQSLGYSILDHLLELLNRIPSFTEYPDPRNSKKTVNLINPQLFAAVLAMKEIFRQAEMEECSLKLFPKVFSSILLLCGVFVDSYAQSYSSTENQKEKNSWPPLIVSEKKMDKISPIRVVIEAFQVYLLCSKQEDLLNSISDKGNWVLLESIDTFADGIADLARALNNFAPQYLATIVSLLNLSIRSTLTNHRIVVTAFFAELINQRCHGESALLELLLNSLVSSLIDPSRIVRKMCIRGLGHIGQVGADQYGTMEWFGVHKYSTTVLSAMLAGLDDKDDPQGDITLESMNGLSKVLAEIDPSLVYPVLINIVLRIRPCFENERPEIRASSFNLFGDLAKFGKDEAQSPFVEQIHSNVVTLLLHLNDDDELVIKSCKHALRQIGPLLNSEMANNMFQKHLRDDAVLYYEEFMNDLTKILVKDFPQKISVYLTTTAVYFKSSCAVIQGNAAMFAGIIIGNLPLEVLADFAIQPICSALILLLKSPVKDVRIKAAEAMSTMFHSL